MKKKGGEKMKVSQKEMGKLEKLLQQHEGQEAQAHLVNNQGCGATCLNSCYFSCTNSCTRSCFGSCNGNSSSRW